MKSGILETHSSVELSRPLGGTGSTQLQVFDFEAHQLPAAQAAGHQQRRSARSRNRIRMVDRKR